MTRASSHVFRYAYMDMVSKRAEQDTQTQAPFLVPVATTLPCHVAPPAVTKTVAELHLLPNRLSAMLGLSEVQRKHVWSCVLGFACRRAKLECTAARQATLQTHGRLPPDVYDPDLHEYLVRHHFCFCM